MNHPFVITYLLLAVTVLVSVKGFSDPSFTRKYFFNAHDVVHYKNWYRCFTHGFLHANWMHLGFNMYGLYLFGRGVEIRLIDDFGIKGYIIYAVLYLLGIIVSTTWPLIKNKDNPGYNALGASGAVSAVVFAFIILNPTSELGLIILPGIYLPAYIFGPLYLVAEYLLSRRGGTGIAHDAHIGGAIFGIIFIIIVDYHYLLDFIKEIT